MNRRNFISTLAAFAAASAMPSAHSASGKLPSGPIRIIVGFPAGGGTDILARIVANQLNKLWGVPVVVENKAGAAGLIAAREVARAAPDGKTLMMGHINALGILPALNPRLGFDAEKDFTAVALVGQTPQVLVANPKAVKAVADLVKLCKSKPGEVTFGSSGIGSAQHLALALFEQTAGVSALHIPYKGAAPLMTDLVGGQIEYAFEGMTTAAPFIKSGKVQVLAQTGTKRAKSFSDVPTVAESGFPDFNASIWFGLVGPGQMPSTIVSQMNSDVNKVLAMPEVISQLEQFGAEGGGGTAESFESYMREERKKWAQLIKARAITLEN